MVLIEGDGYFPTLPLLSSPGYGLAGRGEETMSTFSKRGVPWDDLDPIREDLFSMERIAGQARLLARTQTVILPPGKGRSLTGRLNDNAAMLLQSHQLVAKAIEEGQAITPAAEWLLDNYYL